MADLTDNWLNWCRLCAKYEGNDIDVFFKLESVTELSILLQKYFLISVTPFDETPTAICNDCFKFVSKLEKFAAKCSKVDKMFAELVYDKSNNLDNEVHTVRYKYGIDEEEKCTTVEELPLSVRLKINQSTDTNDLQNSRIDHIEIKEEASEIQNQSGIQTRRKRGRPKRAEFEKGEIINIIKVEHVDEISKINEIDPDYMPRDANPDEDELNFESDIIEDDLQRELEELDDVSSSESEKAKPVRKRQKRKKSAEVEIISCPVPECNITFHRRKTYENHMRTKHPDPENVYTCTICPKQFTTEKKLKIHEISHLPQEEKLIHPCPYCDKKFTKAVNVQAHIRAIHIGDRPFICEECGKSFVAKGALKEHQIIHSDERPYQCAHCPKKFKNLPRLKTHEDIHNETTYVCPHCGLQLNTKRTLKMHMVVHSDQKKYKCQYCGNEYKRSKALKNHLILHTGLRPYICPFCDKTFANGSNCRSHKKKSHPLELAALEASGEVQSVPNIPKLENLQPKKHQIQQQVQDIILDTTSIVKHENLSDGTLGSPARPASHNLLPIGHNGIQTNMVGIMSGNTSSHLLQVSPGMQQSPVSMIPTSSL